MVWLHSLFFAFIKRLTEKAIQLIPILVGGGLFLLVLALLTYFFEPLIPQHYRDIYQPIAQGDWSLRKSYFKSLFDDLGSQKATVFVAVQILQVVFAPIPGQVFGLLGGFLFGFWQGLALSMLGLMIGSGIAMGVGRLTGMSLVRRFVPTAIVVEFDQLIQRGGIFNFFMIFLLPLFPDDAICFVAGLTRLSFWKLMLASFLGRLPGMALLVYMGSQIEDPISGTNAVFVFAMASGFFLWVFDRDLKELFLRWASPKKI